MAPTTKAKRSTKKTEAASAAQTDQTLLRPVLSVLDELLEVQPDPIFQAAATAMRRHVERQSRSWDRRLTKLRGGEIELRHIDEVRETSLEMFRKLADRSVDRSSGRNPNAGVYRGVSVCRSSEYFQRPFIATLTQAFAVAVAMHLDKSEGQPRLVLDRRIIVPNRYWLRPEDKMSDDQRNFWRPIQASLSTLAHRYGPGGSSAVELNIRLMPIVAVKECRLSLRSIDFGLYGDVAVGLYRHAHQREFLTICPGNSGEMRRCEAVWQVLTNPSLESATWDQMAVLLSSDVCTDSPW